MTRPNVEATRSPRWERALDVMRIAVGVLGALVIGSWLVIAAAHIDDTYHVDHVSAAIVALAVAAVVGGRLVTGSALLGLGTAVKIYPPHVARRVGRLCLRACNQGAVRALRRCDGHVLLLPLSRPTPPSAPIAR
jgi:hypothetical protein